MGELRSVVDRFYEAYNTGDFDRGLQLLDEGVETLVTGAPPMRGRDEFRVFAQAFKDAAPDSRLTADAVIEAGDAVVVEGRFTGTHTGPLVGSGVEIPASGKEFDFRYAEVFRIDGGKITSHHTYYDEIEFLTQIGALAPMA